MSASSNKILVVGPAWVGDMVMAQTLFKLIKSINPDAQIDVLAPGYTQALVQKMPEVAHGISSPFTHGELALTGRYRLGVMLRANSYQQAIVLPNSFKSALVPFWAKIPHRTGWRGEMRYGVLNDIRKLDKSRYPKMIQRFMALALPAEASLPINPAMPRLEVGAAEVEQSLAQFDLESPQQPILALCPGAEYGPAKRWPVEYFAEVANQQISRGWQVWLFGSPKDSALAEQIQILTDHQCVNLTGRTSLAQAVDLLSLASAVVTNDSGLMHVAAALDRKTIVIYGSSSAEFTPPLTNKAKILSLHLECSPCFKRECPLQHLRCLKDLLPQQVNELLENDDFMTKTDEQEPTSDWQHDDFVLE